MASQILRELVNKDATLTRLRGPVVHGFGRGSRDLGFPTANLEIKYDEPNCTKFESDILDFMKNEATSGIYAGYAQVLDPEGNVNNEVHKAAISIGWNPTYGDLERRTFEVWILFDYGKDVTFYGAQMRVVLCGKFRDEMKFDDFDVLIQAIKDDGKYAASILNERYKEVLNDEHWDKTSVAGA